MEGFEMVLPTMSRILIERIQTWAVDSPSPNESCVPILGERHILSSANNTKYGHTGRGRLPDFERILA